jgi:hypothetical protein
MKCIERGIAVLDRADDGSLSSNYGGSAIRGDKRIGHCPHSEADSSNAPKQFQSLCDHGLRSKNGEDWRFGDIKFSVNWHKL